jgi:hypothetical protein
MKNIIRKIKDWLIDKLGGYTKADMNLLYESQVAVRKLLLQAWANVVQEICRKSDDTYYDWCCEYCDMKCDKHNGWCEKFMPAERQVFDDNIHRGGINDERRC